MKRKLSLANKILLIVLLSVTLMGVVSGLLFYYSINKVSDKVISITDDMGTTTSDVTSLYMSEQIQNSMLELAGDKANVADQIFHGFKRSIEIVAFTAAQIYNNPSLYLPRKIDIPKMENDGNLSLQILYDSNTNPNNAAIKKELGLIGNIGDVIVSVNDNHQSIASVYLATESGFTVQADYIAGKKFDELGNLLPLEAKQRPWYIGAKETGKTYMTGVVRDVHTPRLGIMCGVPIYRGTEFMGVAGGGMYLDEISNLVESVDLGGIGDACIINSNGAVLFSTRSSGSLVPVVEGGDALEITNEDLVRISKIVITGQSGVELMEIDGENCYVAYAPLKTVEWELLLILPQEVVDAPNTQLQNILKDLQSQVSESTSSLLKNMEVMMFIGIIIVLIFALFNSYILSSNIVKPINKLTKEVKTIQGDNLDFHWNMNTGDETQELAESFESLTVRMKQYIDHIQEITAEKERIDAEMSLARKIQYSALPHQFPPFPEYEEFDLCASMVPAREVGGDFYDFFMIDEDHLALVIADVSGKGIPGALFMMTSMVMIRNNAMGRLPVDRILNKTNLGICRNNSEDMFITAWIGILEISTGIITCGNAGHEYPMIKKPDGRFELFKDKHDLVIGAMEDVEYHSYQLQLEPGTKIFVYTDGVPESTNADMQLFGMERTLQVLNADPDSDPQSLLMNVTVAIDEYAGEMEQFDDITMLCIEYKGNSKKPASGKNNNGKKAN